MLSRLFWLPSAWRRRSPPQASIHFESCFEKIVKDKKQLPHLQGVVFLIGENVLFKTLM
jgi:hypothetical protein